MAEQEVDSFEDASRSAFWVTLHNVLNQIIIWVHYDKLFTTNTGFEIELERSLNNITMKKYPSFMTSFFT